MAVMIALCTNRSQSEKLIKIGIPESTADMYITPMVGGYRYSTVRSSNSIKSWSLSKLIDLVCDSKFELVIDFYQESVKLYSLGVLAECIDEEDSIIDALIKSLEVIKEYEKWNT